MVRRSFTKEFKKQVVEEIIGGVSTPAVCSRKYEVAYSVIKRWEKQYALGKLDNHPTCDAGYQAKIDQLERMIGHLTVENDILKKTLRRAVSVEKQNGTLLKKTFHTLEVSEKDARR